MLYALCVIAGIALAFLLLLCLVAVFRGIDEEMNPDLGWLESGCTQDCRQGRDCTCGKVRS